MKRILLAIAVMLSVWTVSAQTKTAYCDVYLRGGGLNLNATIAFNGNTYDYIERVNIGEIINEFAAAGWVLQETVVIPRHPFSSMFTRHKLHLIMKKEYKEGENPFKGLGTTYISPNKKTIEYNGVEAIAIDASNNQTILLAIDGIYGTWDDARIHCENLGDEWRLPSPKEFQKIKSYLQDNKYWTVEEVNKNRAKYYELSFNESYNANKQLRFYIQPIAIVDVSELEQ